jgi:hypothetical protein
MKTLFISFYLIINLSYVFGNPDNTKREVLNQTSFVETDEPEWKLSQKTSAIEVYERWVTMPSGRRTMERKGILNVPNSVDEVLKLVQNPENIKLWMTGVKESTELASGSKNQQIIYLLFHIPWPFKDKDLVAKVTTFDMVGPPGKKIQYSSVANFIPLNEEAERLLSYEASWTITELKPGQTQVIFTALSDTPPIAPRWIMEPVTLKIFNDNLLNLQDLLIEQNYDNLNALKQ